MDLVSYHHGYSLVIIVMVKETQTQSP